MPEAWERQVRRWSVMSGGFRDANMELHIYQTLVGAWPLDDERLRQYLTKAAREAKTHTSWIAPNPAYEESLLAFADAILSDTAFCEDFVRIQKRVAFYGFLNGLSQVVLKATAPGSPDFYQGTELWDFSLVDPDNRRPVDYASRAATLKKMKAASEKNSLSIETLLRRWHDSRIKMFVTWKVLDARSRHAELFREGSYEPFDIGENIVAFTRRFEDDAIVVVVPRLLANLLRPGTFPIGDFWPPAVIPISGTWRNLFTGENLEGDGIALPSLFRRFPVAVLEKA
jgi:(1->4)-alpha-D-glucan 1-alpha-D-glucosylmutase